jgi:hypothetical protein
VAVRVPGVDVHELLQVHRRHLIEAMQQYTRLKADASEDEVGLALVVDAELFRLDAVVRWLDAADVRLKRQPIPTRAPGTGPAPEPMTALGDPQETRSIPDDKQEVRR